MGFSLDDTIAAVATPPGSGGVGIIRISGPKAPNIAAALFAPAIAGQALTHGRMRFGRICEPKSGRMLDEVLCVRFVSPHSFTGQDVVEIHAHGGHLNLQQILMVVLANGARTAGPGEFSLRAFMNRRLDLTRAEAVREIIEAQTDAALDASRRQLKGEVQRLCDDARQKLLAILAHIEAMVDFPDEELPASDTHNYLMQLDALHTVLADAAGSYARGRLLTEGVEVLIAGAPNVGKSSLLNRLLRQERAIVTPTPGTTRDMIEAKIDIGGVPLTLVDTAGLREFGDAIEAIGMQRARERIAQADLVLWVLDGSRPLCDDDRTLAKLVAERKGLVLVNKSDLPQGISLSEVSQLAADWEQLELSAKSGDGLDALEDWLSKWLLADATRRDGLIVTSARHQAALADAADAVSRARAGISEAQVWELVAADLREAMQRLGEIVGVMTPDEILNEIFGKFCIGK